MFTSDRRNAIQQIVAENEKVDVSELARKFNVSEVTIRKDLVFLEKSGIVIRTHGGAVARDNVMPPSGGTRYAARATQTQVNCQAGRILY